MTFFFIGCSNTSYHTIPSGMREDSQDYNTKYNMMDSPDGRRNPNAQVRIFGATYWHFFNLQYIEYMSKTKTKKNNIVRIEIKRGMAELVSKPAGVIVEIADFDIGEDHIETYGTKQVVKWKRNLKTH